MIQDHTAISHLEIHKALACMSSNLREASSWSNEGTCQGGFSTAPSSTASYRGQSRHKAKPPTAYAHIKHLCPWAQEEQEDLGRAGKQYSNFCCEVGQVM